MPSGIDALASLLRSDPDQFDAAARRLADQVVEFPITGNSMGAALPKGTIVRVALGAACAIDDIAVFRQGEAIVAHRMIHRGKSHLITRGDARFAPDPPVPVDRVLGRVVDPPPALRRHPLMKAANSAVRWMTAAALRVSPSLAARLAGLLTRVERA